MLIKLMQTNAISIVEMKKKKKKKINNNFTNIRVMKILVVNDDNTEWSW